MSRLLAVSGKPLGYINIVRQHPLCSLRNSHIEDLQTPSSWLLKLTDSKTSIIQTFFKMSSSSSDSRHPPPYDDADDPLVSKPEKSPRPPISFDSWKQFRWHLISLSGRCLTTALSLSFLILGLEMFSRIGLLSQMEQYGFNAITILLSAFTSLGLGSMLGYLGSMLRWRLLARKKYKMQDVCDAHFKLTLWPNFNY